MNFLTTLTFVCFSTLLFSQELNQFGHIIDKTDKHEYTIKSEGAASKVSRGGLSFEGNTLIELSDGFVTLKNTCGNTPTTLNFYTDSGIKKKQLC